MRNRGFSLLEILVSLSILVPVAIVIIGLFPYAHSINQRGWALSNAQRLAESELEKARAQSFDAMAATTYQVGDRGMTFQITTTITSVDSNLKKITSEVTWQFQQPQHYRLITQVARMGSST